MPPRTRRSAAVAAAALVADMQMESEPEEEEQVDIENEDEDMDVEEADEDEDAEGEGEESQSEVEEDEEVPSSKAPAQPRLKITLKLPATNTSSNSAGTATPDEQEMDYLAFTRTPKRRAKTKVIQDIDVESEDPTSPSESEDQSTQEPPSRSTGTPSAVNVKPMTTRQAVLASVVDPTHVSLDESSRSKKQPLNETELALRREETARKRKNLSEKKLEDEKAETINRLLKKQSRPKNKRTNTLDDRSPMPTASGARTPKTKTKNGDDAEEMEGEDEDEEMADVVEPQEEIKPVMYRWVSSIRSVPGEDKPKVEITFSVPEIVFEHGNGTSTMTSSPVPEVSMEDAAELEKIRKARGPGVCAVKGCGKPRKYRLPKDWTIGACDSTHLRVIANQAQ